jgi:hypothetical protein
MMLELVSSPSRSIEDANTEMASRILDTFPSGSYALSALLRLMDIVVSTSVPTAAVECRVQPRLLINPQFVAQHAQTPEKLLMLVMHELHHVLLGHTTLFPRTTAVQNFVFDAVINGVICRMFPGNEYTALMTDYYDAASFPHCLLRPPPGWPGKSRTAAGIAALPQAQQVRVKEIHAALYSASGASYQEVYEALPKLLDADLIASVTLMGGHSDVSTLGDLSGGNPLLFDLVRSIVEHWPQPPDPIQGRSLADVIQSTVAYGKTPPSARQTLRGLMRKVAGFKRDGQVRRLRVDKLEVQTPMPSLSRRDVVLRALGSQPLLHSGSVSWRHPVRFGERVHVYLDVSGSMDRIKGALYGAVLDCAAFVHPRVHLFSTKVADVTLAELRRGVCQSTGGTDINCVAEHMKDNRVQRALLVTDGWVGKPTGEQHRILDQARVAVAYLGHNINQSDLLAVARHSATLSLGELS